MKGFLSVILTLMLSVVTSGQTVTRSRMDSVKHLNDFQVIEFRRYTLKEGARERFANYFESYFPEAFQQLGAIVFGQFLERRNSTGFTWIRGFKNSDAQGTVNTSFYGGPLWKEHSLTMNNLMVDVSNVLLLRPLSPERSLLVLPAMDPVIETEGAQGVVVAQIFSIKANSVDDFAKRAESTFASYRDAGVREAGVLVTLDAPNNFPRLPVRTDGPHLVWLGIVKDNKDLETRFIPLADRSAKTLSATNLLRAAPELLILEPTRRSRLRWLDAESK